MATVPTSPKPSASGRTIMKWFRPGSADRGPATASCTPPAGDLARKVERVPSIFTANWSGANAPAEPRKSSRRPPDCLSWSSCLCRAVRIRPAGRRLSCSTSGRACGPRSSRLERRGRLVVQRPQNTRGAARIKISRELGALPAPTVQPMSAWRHGRLTPSSGGAFRHASGPGACCAPSSTRPAGPQELRTKPRQLMQMKHQQLYRTTRRPTIRTLFVKLP